MTIKLRSRKGEHSFSISVPANDDVQGRDLADIVKQLVQNGGISADTLDYHALADSIRERGYQIVKSTQRTIVLERATVNTASTPDSAQS